MNLIEYVTDQFEGQIKHDYKGFPERKKYILNHERKKVCINNLCNEITKWENQIDGDLRKEQIRTLAREYGKTFSKLVLRHRKESRMSSTEKSERIRKANQMNELRAEIDEMIKNKEVVEVDRSTGAING